MHSLSAEFPTITSDNIDLLLRPQQLQDGGGHGSWIDGKHRDGI